MTTQRQKTHALYLSDRKCQGCLDGMLTWPQKGTKAHLIFPIILIPGTWYVLGDLVRFWVSRFAGSITQSPK